MSHAKLHPDLFEFIACLTRLEGLLYTYGSEFWAEKVSKVRQVAEKSDRYCVALFLGMYGGMGSFNDIILNASPSINDDFDQEKRLAYDLAQKLK